ncbi:polymorphic toxin-type HINT domain-containing protein [Streptomyces sp. NPDC048845]|uniref:polymorphic toxin-type HINT domain-containing protein n=1 Tax=Streptomyces sp. NPDC048845 TaxID=3155390 RepID=UPI0034193348
MITRPADGRDDSETTGLQHLGAREYAPDIGRFISVDPVMDLADPQQMHGYTYGNNNPVTLSDPTGLRPDGSCGGSGACNVGSKKNPKWETWTPSRNGWSWGWSSSRTTSKKSGSKTYTQTSYLSFNRQSGYSGWSTSVSVKEEERNPVQKVIYGVGDAFYGTVSNVPHAAEYFAWPFDSDCRSGGPGSSGCDYGSQFDDWIGEQGFNVDSATYQLPGLAGALLSHRPTGRGKGRSSSGCNSFLPQTAVLMADGTYKEIADVEVGDKVLATDPRTGKTAGKTVTAEIAGESVKSLVELTLDIDRDKGTKADTITATDGHPFWVPSLKSWVEAGSLKTGQELRSETGRLLEVTAVRQWSEWTSVRNLTVADLHTYYVLAGQTPVLVHNSNCLNWAANSVKTWGHTFKTHGAGAKNTKKLTDRARTTGNQQGQWLDNDAAAEFLKGLHVEGAGPRSVRIPEGMGQVIMPDGSIAKARAATIVPSPNGLYKTGFPIIGPN